MKGFEFKIDSLKRQLLLGILFGIVILVAILEISQYYSLKNNLYSSKFQLLESRLHNVNIDKVVNIDNEEKLKESAEAIMSLMVDINVGISIIDSKGKLLVDSEEKVRRNYINHLLPDEILNSYQYDPLPKLLPDDYKMLLSTEGVLEKKLIVNNSSGQRYMLLISKLGDLGKSSGLIQLSTSLMNEDNIIKKQLLWYIAIAMGVLLLITIILSRFLSFSLSPLNRITASMMKINDNKLNTRLEMDVNQIEIRKLVNEFNGMLERIEDSFHNEKTIANKMRKFVSDAAHELRTPLTSIQGFSQLLSTGEISSESDKKIALESITNESKRLTRLINHLLLLTKLDYKANVEKKPVNIKKIVEELGKQIEFIVGARELTIHSEEVWISSNADQIKQIVINLINNAAQHTDRENGKISIVLKKVLLGEVVYGTIIVSDNGTGIPKEKLNLIFDRFYRVESHRSRKNGGFGLGLSIVKSIVDENQGKIEVESDEHLGSKFTVSFQAIDVSKETLS